MTPSVGEVTSYKLQVTSLAVWSWVISVFVAISVIVLIGWYWPPERLVFPFNHIQSWKYQWLASRLPAGEVKATRFRAMAEAVRQGKTEYEFQTGPTPPSGGK